MSDFTPGNVSDILDKLLNKYMLEQSMANFGARAMNNYLPDKHTRLEEERDVLDIALRKRALGLPMTSDDLDEAVNSDRPFISPSTILSGKLALQAIPKPLSTPKRPMFKIAELVENELPSAVKQASQGGVSRYAHEFERIRSFF